MTIILSCHTLLSRPVQFPSTQTPLKATFKLALNTFVCFLYFIISFFWLCFSFLFSFFETVTLVNILFLNNEKKSFQLQFGPVYIQRTVKLKITYDIYFEFCIVIHRSLMTPK